MRKRTIIPLYLCFSLCILILFVLFFFVRVNLLNAKTTEECKSLAKAFAEDPKKLDDISLAKLRTCISNEIRSRVSGPAGASAPAPRPSYTPPRLPPPPPAPAPAPAPPPPPLPPGK